MSSSVLGGSLETRKRRPAINVGSVTEARAALKRHRGAFPDLYKSGTLDGTFKDWSWYFGGTRIAWRPPDGVTVYKVESETGRGANEIKHDVAGILRSKGKSWAPETSLYRFDDGQGPVLAMPYYPVTLTSNTEIPDDVYRAREVTDFLLSNFRRTAELPGGTVKIIDLGG